MGRSGPGMELVYRRSGRKWNFDKAAEEVCGKAQTTSKAAGGANRCRCQKQHVLQVLGYRALGKTQTGAVTCKSY